MKKSLAMLFSFLFILGLYSPAFCAEGSYVSLSVGAAMMPEHEWDDPVFSAAALDIELESDFGVAVGVACGYAFKNNVRLEAEIAYQTNDLDKITANGAASLGMTGDSSSLAFLANGYYDFANQSRVTPFVTAGIGFAQVNMNDMNFTGSGVPDADDSDVVLAYQVGAGVGFSITEQTTLDIKYRYFGTSDPEYGNSTIEYSSHNVYLGVRFNF